MPYTISGESGGAINFAPRVVAEEVLQNVRTLLMTGKYSVPLHRELGIDLALLDKPAPEAMARLRVHIVQEVERFEPRARITAVDFKPYEGAADGRFYPILQVEIVGG